MDNLSPKKLAELLVEKHDRLISGYSDEVDKTKQISILKEKKDQLLHWVEEKGTQSKYGQELKDTTAELKKLQTSFTPKNQSYYAGVEQKIRENKEAREYWMGKIGETKT